MLPDRYTELLTAYVDGELSARQQAVVQQLLRRSGEARALVRQFQADAELLRGLPRRQLGPDFARQILDTVRPQGVRTPVKAPAPGRALRWPAWAAAAAILVSVGVLSYLAFPLFVPAGGDDQVAVRTGPDAPPPSPSATERLQAFPENGEDTDETPREKRPGALGGPDGAAPPNRTPGRDVTARRGKSGKKPADEFLTFGGDTPLPSPANPNLSLILPLQRLGDAAGADRLRAKLHSGRAFHIDLLCRDPGTAVRQLQAAFRTQGIDLAIDPKALARLKNPRLQTKYAFYGENLTAAELTAAFTLLAQNDQQRVARQKLPEQYGIFSIYLMSPAARKKIADFLGQPPAYLPQRPAAAAKKGGAQRGPAAPAARRLVLVLPYHEDNSPVLSRPRLSPAVKSFLAERQPRQAGTVQIVLVLSRDSV
jgi:hypothetical protein